MTSPDNARRTAGASEGRRLTVYGCGQDEAALFEQLAPDFGLVPTLTGAPLSAENTELARGARCVSISHKSEVTGDLLARLRMLGVTCVSTRSVGSNHIDVEAARCLGMSVESIAYSPDCVADYTLMLMLMTIRHVGSILRRVRVHDYRLHEQRGRELRDLTVGVIGTGRIGAAVVERLKGFGCVVLAHDPCPTTTATYVELDGLLRRSDVVTLHTPLTGATRHLLDRRRLDAMPAGAIVVNTARGGLIDTGALVSSLESGHLGGAALDVVEGEEGVFYADRRRETIRSQQLLRLHRLPNVLLSPHTAYFTDHALRDTVEGTLESCCRLLGAAA